MRMKRTRRKFSRPAWRAFFIKTALEERAVPRVAERGGKKTKKKKKMGKRNEETRKGRDERGLGRGKIKRESRVTGISRMRFPLSSHPSFVLRGIMAEGNKKPRHTHAHALQVARVTGKPPRDAISVTVITEKYTRYVSLVPFNEQNVCSRATRTTIYKI